MTTWFCDHARIDGAIADDVVLETEGGVISKAASGVDRPPGATHLAGVTIPGLANVHSHAFHRALRGRTHHGASNFWSWRDHMYAIAERLDPDGYRRLARVAFAEMVQAGITAVGEFHYVHHQPDGKPYDDPNEMSNALIAAAHDAGIKITLLDTCYLASGFGAEPEGVQVRFSDGDAASWTDRVSGFAPEGALVAAAIHSVRAVPGDAAEEVASWAQAAGRPLHFHLSEQPAENEASLEATGLTPARLLHEAGALGPMSTAVHATHLETEDIDLLGKTGTSVCMCPTTERELADGIGPAGPLKEAGVRLTLGSDSHAVIDLVEEARLVELHERLAHGERGHHSAADLLRAATTDGMVSLGRDGGGIGVGLPADFATVRLDSPRTAGAGDPLTAVVFASTAADISDVVIDGEHLVREGRHSRLEDLGGELAAAVAAVTE